MSVPMTLSDLEILPADLRNYTHKFDLNNIWQGPSDPFFVIQMLMRDLFAVANLVVLLLHC